MVELVTSTIAHMAICVVQVGAIVAGVLVSLLVVAAVAAICYRKRVKVMHRHSTACFCGG